MRIGITGASGFIGTHFTQLATQRGHEVISYSRRARPGSNTLVQPADAPWQLPQPDRPLDVLLHLAGEPVFGLWTAAKRERIRDSRVAFTESLVHHLATWTHPPAAVLVASGVGFYGDRGDAMLTESSPPGNGFLADVCIGWEAAAQRAEERLGARIVSFRTGLVLGNEGGAFPLMRRAFRFGLGGRFGSGRQWMPWIHIADEVGLMLWAAENVSVNGPLNLCAPNPVTNAEFTRTLASALHRPAFLHAPAFALKAVLGDLAQEMLLNGQRALPAAAQAGGYTFQYPDLAPALAQLLAR
jgi:uncharacterized protein (TIGR01777 family)